MDSMISLMDLMVAGCGLYILYGYYMLKYKGEIKEGLLLPKDVEVKKCKDKAAYIGEIAPKMLVYGIAVTICGIVGIADAKLNLLGNWYFALLAVFFACTVWFIIVAKKAVEKYWPGKKKK